MKLSDLVATLGDVRATGPLDVEWRGLTYDSRKVKPGYLYCALKGQKHDATEFAGQAIEKGAVGVLSEKAPTHVGVAWLHAGDARASMADAAALFYGHPSERLLVAGVTGTNGKTTTAFLLQHLLKASRRRAGLLGTVVYDDGITRGPANHTTPESVDLQEILARMAENQCAGVAMEVSSHALAQSRARAVAFDAAIFTNLTQDHLDFHATMEDYFEAKALLFEQVVNQSTKKPTAVINTDDPWGRRLATRLGARGKFVRYGFGVSTDYRASNVKFDLQGTQYQLEVGERKLLVRTPLIGRFNVYNSLASLAGAVACGLNLREAVSNLSLAPQVPGRLESVAEKRAFRVFVDYAHTPDALQNVLTTLREVNPRRLIVVFGCGGDRDAGKRPLMGAVAAEFGDLVIVTSDNPRTEDPAAILKDIVAGLGATAHLVIEDRAEAIARAIDFAQDGDIVLIAGKGHEDYQIFADRTIDFDDRKAARRAIENKAVAKSAAERRPPRPTPPGRRKP